MNSKERVLQRERERGRAAALEVQDKASSMDGTQLNAVDDRIPRFTEAVKRRNMLDRPLGFVCKSSAGRVVRLIQPYDSDIYRQEPEELSAHYGFVWSKDPKKARPFISLATSPYMTGECCTYGGETYASRIDHNVWAPSSYPDGWEKVL